MKFTTSRAVGIPAAALAIASIAACVSVAFADSSTTSYKQAFTAAGTSMSGVFNVLNDESGIQYSLNGSTSATLSCQTGSGTSVAIANLGASGTVSAGSLLSTASQCNPAITTTSHLVQDMREGKVYLSSGSTQLMLNSSAVSMTAPVVSSGSTTSTSTPVTTGSTTPTTGSTTPTTGTTTVGTIPASDLRVALNNILRDHITTSLDALHEISDLPAGATTSPRLAAALAAQDQNAVDLSNAIGLVYGDAADSAFLSLFRAHIVDSNAFTMGVKNGSITDQKAALADLDLQLQNLSSFLSTANPYIGYDALLGALRQHEELVNTSSVDYANGDYTGAYTVEKQAEDQISGGADFLASGIVAQFPNVFTK